MLGAALRGITLDDNIVSFDIAEPAQRLVKPTHPEWTGCLGELTGGDAGMNERNTVLHPRLLSAGCKWPYERRAAKNRNEITTSHLAHAPALANA